MESRYAPILGYGMIGNALFAGEPPPVQWSSFIAQSGYPCSVSRELKK
jgi:hypothetical protein